MEPVRSSPRCGTGRTPGGGTGGEDSEHPIITLLLDPAQLQAGTGHEGEVFTPRDDV